MTYLELLNRLKELPPERLNDNVTVYHKDQDGYFVANGHDLADKNNVVLDEGHFFLIGP